MSDLCSKGNTDPNVGNAASTLPSQPTRRGTRSHASANPESSPTSYGHFPPAPHTYPIPPLTPAITNQTPIDPPEEHLNPDNTTTPTNLPGPITNPAALPKRHLAGAAPPPPAKRSKKTKQKAPKASVSASLQGIGPVVAPSLSSSSTNIGPVDPQPIELDSGETNYSSSPYWEHVYPLDLNAAPPVRPTINRPLLLAKPKSAYVGCRSCNQPSEDGNNILWQAWTNINSVISNVLRHLKSKHPQLLPEANSTSKTPHEQGVFDLEHFVDTMITWVVVDDQALHVVDSKPFRNMIMAANPAITDKEIPHCTTISTQILKRYKQERIGLCEKLKNALGRVSLTTDLWSDSNLTSFMAVTLHWIARTEDGELEMKTALGGFRWVKNKHSGENIATRLLEVLVELDIVDRIGGITMDNAQNNDTAMDSLEQHLTARGIKFSRQEQRIRCFSHVLNLAVQDALAQLPLPDAFKSSLRHIPDNLRAKWHEGQEDGAYATALKSDLVGRVQDLVRHLRSSGQRQEALQEAINTGKQAQLLDPPLRPLQLLRHVETRWSSSFHMLKRFHYLSPAITLLLSTVNATTLTRDDLLNVRETAVLADILEYFSFFDAVQEALACEKTPTLPFVLYLYEQLLALLGLMCHEYPKLMHAVYASLQKLKKYHEECRVSSIYTLAMVLNPAVKFKYLTDNWEPEEVEAAKITILAAMTMHSQPVQGSSVPIRTPLRNAGLSERNLNHAVTSLSSLAAKLKSRSTTPQPENPPIPEPLNNEEQTRLAKEATQRELELELRSYMDEDVLTAGMDLSFHTILSYWKSSAHKFPCLFQLAMTILAIPATSVPSERVFSSSARTDTAARNRLSPVLMEALQILKFNRRNNVLDFSGAIRDDPKDLEVVIPEEMTENEAVEAIGVDLR